jgi:glycosyltransferase involved in cell wall biosynthesis
MRVLAVLVGAAARTGGPPAFVGGSAMELRRLGVDVRVLATDLAFAPWGWWQRQRRVRRDELHPTLANSDTRLFAARFPRRLAFSPGLSRSLREMVPACDVVHVHNLWQFPQYAGYKAALAAGVPYIVSPHGGLDPYLRQRGRARKRLTAAVWQDEMLAKATLIHVTTEGEKELIADIAPQVPRAVVPCGLYVDEFTSLPPPDAFRRERLDGYDGPMILFLGRITQKKGVDLLIRAFAELRPLHECRLVIVGPDDEGILPGLRRLVGELGIARDVVFLDAVFGDERLAALSSADVWALSSHTENFGIAVVEAMAAGCAVVTTPGVNLAAEIASADAGIVAEATPDGFAEALLETLSDDQRRARLERTARTFAARYDWSAVAPRLLDMYSTAAASPASR